MEMISLVMAMILMVITFIDIIIRRKRLKRLEEEINWELKKMIEGEDD